MFKKLVPHHQLDLIDPDESYSAGKYARDASSIIEKVAARKRLPILVGGTGLYYRALMYGISKIPSIPEKHRKKVQAGILNMEQTIVGKNCKNLIRKVLFVCIQMTLQEFYEVWK